MLFKWKDQKYFMQETDVVYIKYSYINTFLQKLTAQYRQEESMQAVAGSDGNKKIPVWLLWLQGEDQINEAYDAGVYDDMINDTTFFKLSYKTGYVRATEDGHPTLYDHLIWESES